METVTISVCLETDLRCDFFRLQVNTIGFRICAFHSVNVFFRDKMSLQKHAISFLVDLNNQIWIMEPNTLSVA